MASTPYKHFVPPVPLNPDYESTKRFVLIESLDQLKESFKKGQVIAWDTETTGLNPIESEIVGFSYSYDGVTGYYCPVKHFDLALGKPALDLFYQALKDSKFQLLYNARFDIRMMEYSGYDMSFLYPKDQTGASHAMFFDVMNQVWLSDTNVPLPSLKASTLHFLGYQPPKFLDTLGDEQNFQYVPAKDAYKYACFTGDTLIQTKHGLKQINQLTPLVDLIKTSTGYHRLLDILKQGVRDVIRVTTPSGTSFICTPDHKFAVHIKDKLQWIQAKYLDKIPFYCLYRGGESLNSVEEEYTPQEPYTLIDTCAIEYLGSPQFVYDLTIDGEHNFTLQCGAIAHNCLDAINTLNLFRVTYKYYKESGIAAQMDNQCIYIIGQLEKTPLNINTDYLIKLRDQVYNRVLELEQEIYSLAGRQFKIGSNRELTQVFIEQGIDTGERTKAGDMKTGIELLNLYLRNHPDCTLLNLIIEYKEQFKFYNSYLKTLVDIAKQQDTVPPRFSYKLQSVPCLTTDNMVLLRDKGLVSVSIVQEGDFIWTQYGYKRVLWCNSHKSDNVYLVQFSNGLYIEGTGHHPVLVNNGTETDPKLEWSTLEALNLNERVIFNHHTPPLSFYDEELNQKEEDMAYYLEDLGILSSIYLNAYMVENDAYTQFKKDFFDSLSLPLLDSTVEFIGSAENVIRLVRLVSPNLWIHFIRGLLFATFESEQAQKWNIPESSKFVIKSDNPNLLSFVMSTLLYLGIASAISTDETDQFTLSFTTQQSLSLLNLLVVEDSDSEYLKSLFRSFHLSSFYLEYADAQVVRKGKVEGEHTVYDIEVEDVHEFVANGVVTHNTGRLASGKDGKNTYFSPINLQCLEENTLIKTERGNIPIKDVKTGDKVWTGNQYSYCQQLGSKIKSCYKVKTYWGEIEASLEHNFLTLNIYHGYKIEWHTLAECITMGLPLVRDPQALGLQFDELYNHPIFSDHSDTTFDYPPQYSKIWQQREELTLDQYREALDKFKDFKFDIIIETPWVLWRPYNPAFEAPYRKTVYDLYVPNYNLFTANGFIVHNSLPKPKSIKCYGRKATQEEIEAKKDTLGWIFSPDHPEWSPGLVVEGMSQTLNVRSAFQPEHPENGDYVVSIDMSGEELRVVTNLFKEHSWAKVINSGGDLHHANSDALFGPENYTKETRKRSKGAAFGMLYGQEARGFQRKFPEMTLDEAREFITKFKRIIPSITRGQERMIRDARKTGTFYSGFGRPRRVKHYLTSADYRDVAFGERTIKNSPIQSTAADVLKMEFIRLWDNIFTVYPEIKFICTIHDEINFSVPRKLADKVIPMMIRCMTVKMPDWLVTLDCSLSAGPALGEQYPFKYNFTTKEFVPDWEEDKRKESKEEIVVDDSSDLIDENFIADSETLSTNIVEDEEVEEIDSKMFDF